MHHDTSDTCLETCTAVPVLSFPMLFKDPVCHYSVGLCTAEALNLPNMGSERPAFFPPQVNSCCCGYRSATVQTLFNVYNLLWLKMKRTSCMSRMWESQHLLQSAWHLESAVSCSACFVTGEVHSLRALPGLPLRRALQFGPWRGGISSNKHRPDGRESLWKFELNLTVTNTHQFSAVLRWACLHSFIFIKYGAPKGTLKKKKKIQVKKNINWCAPVNSFNHLF